MNIFVAKNYIVRFYPMDNNVSKELILWYMINKRDLPWRNTHDPYHVWVSEIILQQTRVAQGLSYYLKFIEAFPTIKSLADAKQEQVLKLWQGLGYYSRARNMHSAAKQIIDLHNGIFPDRYTNMLQLKGVGEYTAAAVASIAFNEAKSVVDGNVIRVISRLFAIQEPVDKPSSIREIKMLASEMLDKAKPALHNQAMMEFGALQCVPANPDCINCPLNHKCLAYKYKIVDKIPFKSQKVKVRNRYFYYLVIKLNNGFYFQKRGAGDIWEGLYEFPLIETGETTIPETIPDMIMKKVGNQTEIKIINISEPLKHILTHQKLHVYFIMLQTSNEILNTNWTWIEGKNIFDVAVPKVIDNYLHSPFFGNNNEYMVD